MRFITLPLIVLLLLFPVDISRSSGINNGTDLTINGTSETLEGTTDAVFFSKLPGSRTAQLTTASTAYFLYMGRVVNAMTVARVKFMLVVAGAGAQTSELGIFSTPNHPTGSNQTMTRLTATATIGALTGTNVVIQNTNTFATSVASGTYLWAGVRINMATTQPTPLWVYGDLSSGTIETLAAAGSLTISATFAATVPADVNALSCVQMQVTLN